MRRRRTHLARGHDACEGGRSRRRATPTAPTLAAASAPATPLARVGGQTGSAVTVPPAPARHAYSPSPPDGPPAARSATGNAERGLGWAGFGWGGGQPKRKKPCRGGRCITPPPRGPLPSTHRRPLVVSTAPDSAPAVRNVLNIGWPSDGSLLARFVTGPSLSTTTNDTGLAAGRTGVGGGYISTS